MAKMIPISHNHLGGEHVSGCPACQEPAIDEQPVYDFSTGKTWSREEYNRIGRLSRKAAEHIYEAAEASENITCPGIGVMTAIIWRTLFGEEKNQYRRAADER